MTRLLWYLGWLVVWFVVLWSFVFVPLSNLFREGGFFVGFVRGVILVTGAFLLVYGFYFISRRLRATKEGSAPAFGGFQRAQVYGGMTEREAAVVAQARADAQSAARAVGQDGAVAGDPRRADPATAVRDPGTDVLHPKADAPAPAGIMKSAGNPVVRKAFAQAMNEVDTKTYDTGLWAMALVECNGDENVARLAYMKARAADLVWADAKATESAQPTAQRQDDSP